jgi:hypothetical protein
MDRKAASGIMLTLLIISVLTLAFNIQPVKAEPIWWFDYTTNSVCWRADLAKGRFYVDFDGDHSTAALSDRGGWKYEYGNCFNLGVVKIYHNEYWLRVYGWAFTIGELIIPRRDAHIHETYVGNMTEWFYFWVPKTTPPSDWVICLQKSDGVNPIPVTSKFWYSEDEGITWKSFDPSATFSATLDIYPSTLNLLRTGQWITAYVEFPEGYNVSDIDVSSIVLNHTILVDPNAPTIIGDYDNDTIPDLMVKFNRTAVSQYILSKGIMMGNVTLTISGQLYDATPFTGSDLVRVRMPGDINGDGIVDISDIAMAAKAFGSYPGHPRWNPEADLNSDGVVDIVDIATIATNFGKTYP